MIASVRGASHCHLLYSHSRDPGMTLQLVKQSLLEIVEETTLIKSVHTSVETHLFFCILIDAIDIHRQIEGTCLPANMSYQSIDSLATLFG